jgi:hypothetical protein
MSEPFLDRLSRFTPDSGRLDRDALLFAAGRSSARPARGWIALASLLTGTQALSLVLLWPRPTLPTGRSIVPVASGSTPPAALELPPSEASANPGLWTARHRLRESKTEAPPAGEVSLIDGGPPLRAFPPPRSLLN